MALAEWRESLTVLESKGEGPSNHQLMERLYVMISRYIEELSVEIKVEERLAVKAGEQFGWHKLYGIIGAAAVDWQDMPKKKQKANLAGDSGKTMSQQLCFEFLRGKCRRGSDCKMSHGPSGDIPMCKFGKGCELGEACKFRHPGKSGKCLPPLYAEMIKIKGVENRLA